jgi:hypothetical protein
MTKAPNAKIPTCVSEGRPCEAKTKDQRLGSIRSQVPDWFRSRMRSATAVQDQDIVDDRRGWFARITVGP